ncbi:histidine phosphatase family protein [Periweissella cryptocerci]|uniref:Histidine phosphatase family protein n=1 Tax=Periweissella cryptocerci TaxID=2506420 RepID=A0A4P6YSK4_9LACO|nr:histidine phosphatase family protein [Periweissella cryptocerci]QBO35607.1 histidine phosphatase family protein [Periweissella cryptocerci]
MKKIFLLFISPLIALMIATCIVHQTASHVSNQPLNIYLVRHGQTILNTHSRIQGWSDSPLTATGIAQASTVGKNMHKLNFIAAYSADNQRTNDTARLILKNANDSVKIQKLKYLREGYYGSFEGDKTTTYTNKLPKVYDLNSDTQLRQKYSSTYWQHIQNAYAKLDTSHEAEASSKAVSRFNTALKKITAKHTHGNVLVVSSGMVTMEWLESQHIRIDTVRMLPNNSVTKLTYIDGKLKVDYFGSEAFLK